MKAAVTYGYFFTPVNRNIDLSAIPGFDVRKLYAIINTTTKTLIYATATPGLGYSNITGGNVLTLEFNTIGMQSNDLLQIIYDDNFQIVQTVVQNDVPVMAGKYLQNSPTLDDGDRTPLMVDKQGNLKITGDSVVTITNLDDIDFPLVQTVQGDRVNNESIGLPNATVPNKVTLIGGNDNSSARLRPFRVDADGVLFTQVTNLASNQTVNGTVAISNLPTTQSVNQTQINGASITLGRKSAASSYPCVLSNEDILDQVITGAGPNLPALGVNLLNAVTGSSAIDCQQYRSIAFQINCVGAVNAVTVTFEGSNDNVNFQAVSMFDIISPTSAPITSFATAAGINRFFSGPILFRYFRVRTAAAITSGTVQAFTILRMQPYVNSYQILSTTQALGTIAQVTAVTAAQLASGIQLIVASAAITTNTTSSTLSSSNIQSQGYIVNVTAVSGTNPTLDISIEESYDGGTNWHKVYDMERITATGAYRTPIIANTASSYRVVRTVGGTTPSFTMSMTSTNRSSAINRTKRLINRTIDPNTLNSTTQLLEVRESSIIKIVQCSNAGASVAPVLTLQGSEDGTEWYDLPCTLTGTASTNSSASLDLAMCAFVRLRVSTAGTGASFKYVSITVQ